MKRAVAGALLLIAAACHDVAGVGNPGGTTVTTTTVSFPGGTITAKIAATVAARDSGLMNVTTLAANSGMLFVYGTDHAPANCAYWMSNTPLPLSIAFIDATMKVINTDEMAAETTAFHMPAAACRYVLEANQGWFSQHNVTPGTTVTFTLPAGTIIDP